MARMFLREDFTADEIATIQAHEPQVRNILADYLNPILGDRESPISKSAEIDRVAEALANRVFDVKESGIRTKFVAEVTELLKRPVYAANCREIITELKSKDIKSEHFFKDNFKLSEAGLSKIAFDFLLDLYKLSLHFGGGNTIGKGELCFAALLSDAKLASHRETNSKVDLVTKDGLTVELKADGGRLDGSGIKPSRISINDVFSCLMKAIAEDLRRVTGEDIYNYNDILYWTENGFTNAARAFTTVEKNFSSNEFVLGNPFSRKSIQSFWFTVLPVELARLIKALNSTKVNSISLNINVVAVLNRMLLEMYSLIYQNTDFGAERDFIEDQCDTLCRIILDHNDVEDFVVTDTIIRARIYMAIDKDGGAAHKGILVFTKPVNNDIFGCRVDYRAGQDAYDWRRKNNSELKITPSNDNVRAAHAIRIV